MSSCAGHRTAALPAYTPPHAASRAEVRTSALEAKVCWAWLAEHNSNVATTVHASCLLSNAPRHACSQYSWCHGATNCLLFDARPHAARLTLLHWACGQQLGHRNAARVPGASSQALPCRPSTGGTMLDAIRRRSATASAGQAARAPAASWRCRQCTQPCRQQRRQRQQRQHQPRHRAAASPSRERAATRAAPRGPLWPPACSIGRDWWVGHMAGEGTQAAAVVTWAGGTLPLPSANAFPPSEANQAATSSF